MAANRIPSPVTRGFVRMPMIMQYENLECGSVSLAMVLGYYGKWIAPGVVRAATGPCRDGGNAENIAKAARSYGLHADVEQISTEEFYAKATFPCIVHWEYNHFLVIRGVRGNNVYINDPKKGDYKVPKETFAGKFTGIVVFLRPEPDFQPEGHRKSLWEFILEHLEGSWGSLAFVLVTTMLISILTLANQGMSRIFLDRLIKGQNPEWTGPFIGLLTMIAVSMIVVTLIRDYYILRINGKLAISSNAAYMEKIFKLPISFFNQRLPGDINFRRMMMGEIASTLVQTFGPLLLQIVMMILYLIVMVNYSPILTMIGIASIVINAAMARIISRIRINITRRNMTNTGQATSTLSAGIQMIETIKASGAENGFFELWSGYQAGVVGASVEYAKVDHVLGVIPIAVSTLSNHVVTMAGVFLIIHGQFTPGMLMAFQGILAIFNKPANQLIDAGRDIQEMRTKMERIDDVMEEENDPMWKDDPMREDVSYDKLKGQVSMKGVSFGYSRLDEPLIRDFNLDLSPGKSVALVGPSGCGKSTITKLISGLYQPWAGEITFGGVPLKELDPGVLRGSLAIVDQDIILFEDTIANNLSMWDSTIEDFELYLAANDAQIHEDILRRDKGYQHVMLPEGKDFSGGQRQRLEIARVLAQDPSIIILDEATSALDAKTEFDVVRSIRDRGVTCIVIAHRLSTIRDCDEIIVLDHGLVVERGTHNELLRKDGRYAELVKSE